MAYAAGSFAIKDLKDLLIEEGKFLYGVEDQVEELKAELNRMQGFLKVADANEDGDERIRNWISEITDLAYGIGDLLETYAIQVVSKRERSGLKNTLKKIACIVDKGITVHKVGSKIEAIKSKITNLATSLQNLGVRSLNDGESSTSTNDKKKWLRMSYPHVIEQDFVGMETDMEQLLLRLTDNKNICEVVSIKGMGGLGKTTIATKLYNNTSVQSHFERFGWACITQQCQLKISLQQILKGLVPEKKDEIMKMEDVELVPELHKVLLEKKCLIVIDDIWTKDVWEILKPAFPIGQKGGTKVLLTTRKLEVGFVHQLGCLTEEQGWNLLQLKALPGRDVTPDFRIDPGMKKLGWNIARQCGGLPLAISVLGGILKGKSIREWEMVNKDIESYLRRGDGIEEDQGGLMRVLGLSYIDLPYCLKHCFLYLARYPEDSSIEVEKLCKLWMAEGFISSDDIGVGETMMDVAERYLDELARRSMVQVELVNEDVFSEVKRFESCRFHDMMRELCLLNAKKENFIDHIDVTGDDSSKFATYMSSSITKVRRLSVYVEENCDEYIAHKKHDITRHLRSLMLSNRQSPPLKISGISKFKLMRVLELEGIDFMEKSIPKEIQELIHLRYLSLFNCWIRKLPSCIGKLQYLQTLDLRISNEIDGIILPNVIWNLKRLKHLYLPEEFYLKNKGELLRLDGLFELEILYISMLELCDLVKLASSTNLRILKAFACSTAGIGVQNLINYLNTVPPQQLRSKLIVNIYWNGPDITSVGPELFTFNCLELVGSLLNLPKCDNYSFSRNLTSIQLHKSNLEEDPMIVLENIPNLRNLRLWSRVCTRNVMTCSSAGFPQLRYLELWGCDNLKVWNVKEGAMPKLHTLEINSCRILEMVPVGLRFLQFLKKIVIIYMPKAFLRRVQVIDGQEGEDFYKIRHVNSRTIR